MPGNRHTKKASTEALAFREKLFAFNYEFCLTEQTHIAEQNLQRILTDYARQLTMTDLFESNAILSQIIVKIDRFGKI